MVFVPGDDAVEVLLGAAVWLGWALRYFQWVTQREVMYAGVGLVRMGRWSLAAVRLRSCDGGG